MKIKKHRHKTRETQPLRHGGGKTAKQSTHGIIAFVIALVVLATPAWYVWLFSGKPHVLWVSVVLFVVAAVFAWQPSKEQGADPSYGRLAVQVYRSILLIALSCTAVIVIFITVLLVACTKPDMIIG